MMALSIIYSRAQLGVSAPLVTVETHIANGLPALSIVGLPEAAVKESKDRVKSALVNSKQNSLPPSGQGKLSAANSSSIKPVIK